MANRAYTSAFSALRATMEACSEKVAEAYSKPLEQLEIYMGELPPGHRSTDRRQRYLVTEHGGDMIVALPGTTHPLDWSSNLRVNYTPADGSHVTDAAVDLETVPCAHAGFYYRSETVPTLQLLQQAADNGCRLVFTGHSLGGAVANLCALTALNAQKRILTAAANTAEAEAAARRSSSDAALCEVHIQPPSAAEKAANTLSAAPAGGTSSNHSSSSRSSSSEFALSPNAALVEVLSISFASPVFANAALAQMIEANGWEDCFVNLVVPEDYCLNLFNNVLTSAPQPEGKSPLSRSCSRLKTTRKQTEYSEPQEPSEDPIPEAPLDPETLPVPLAPAAAGHRNSASSDSSSSSASLTPITSSRGSYSYTSTPQQPLVSALAGKSPGRMRSKRQLCFAEPLHKGTSDGPGSLPASSGSDNAAAESNWVEDSGLPQSPSSASLLSEGSSTSTRSWTLLAYLPQSLSRSLGSWSSSSSSRDSSSGGSAASSSVTSDVSDLLDEPFQSWGIRHARSTVDLSSGFSLGSGGSDSGDSTSTNDLDDLAAPFVSYNSFGPFAAHNAADQLDQGNSSDDSACSSDDTAAKPQHTQLLKTLHEDRKASLRRSFSSASLTILTQGHKKLLQPLTSALKAGDSLSLVTSLLPSMRSVVGTSRAVANAAHKVGEKAFNVPLCAIEAGLIRALKPPMYEAVGQQWILSATGLVPQHQPIHQYPKHVSDVYWHKELALVAFKEHSIVFYKRRLLQQASRR